MTRRELTVLALALATSSAAGARGPTPPHAKDRKMQPETRYVTTSFGDIAYTQTGSGPVALFVHGLFLNGQLWHPLTERLGGLRRCIAVDILGHGATRTAPGLDLSFTG